MLSYCCECSIEQGLFGSAALAKKLKSQGTTITMMVQGVRFMFLLSLWMDISALF